MQLSPKYFCLHIIDEKTLHLKDYLTEVTKVVMDKPNTRPFAFATVLFLPKRAASECHCPICSVLRKEQSAESAGTGGTSRLWGEPGKERASQVSW